MPYAVKFVCVICIFCANQIFFLKKSLHAGITKHVTCKNKKKKKKCHVVLFEHASMLTLVLS